MYCIDRSFGNSRGCHAHRVCDNCHASGTTPKSLLTVVIIQSPLLPSVLRRNDEAGFMGRKTVSKKTYPCFLFRVAGQLRSLLVFYFLFVVFCSGSRSATSRLHAKDFGPTRMSIRAQYFSLFSCFFLSVLDVESRILFLVLIFCIFRSIFFHQFWVL